ncbi:MAG TPA: type II secretion system protein [Pyrinomonadaceae bacterium]|nr:type II secretion system protein [Pyrinomonadaceae bacterium]
MIGRRNRQAGFSLLELMIAMFVMVILISVAVPTYIYTVRHARETILRENLDQMRRMIDQYGADKGKLPETLEDLKTAGYLREIPIDPLTDKAEWEEVKGDDFNATDGHQGLTDVKSLAEGDDMQGKPYKEY